MVVEPVSGAVAIEIAARSLGVTNASLGAEFLSQSIRRAASFMAPATRGQLVRAVLEAVSELAPDTGRVREELDVLLEALIAQGDLVEAPDRTTQSRMPSLYLGTPSFVQRRSGVILLFGIRPDGAPFVGEEIAAEIRVDRHLRCIDSSDSSLAEALEDYGLRRVPENHWLRPPRRMPAAEFVRDFDERLASAGPSGQIAGLRILDSTRDVNYYRGRWREPTERDTGHFVARRPKVFGADLWCFTMIEEGVSTRLIDLPTYGSAGSGFDEAWRLQAAIDSELGHPQVIRVDSAGQSGGNAVLKLMSPPPRWLQRRWDVIGSIHRAPGAIVSYSFSSGDIEEEIDFAESTMWLRSGR